MTKTIKTKPDALSTSAVAKRKKLEAVVDAGQQTFVEVGNALKELRDEKLYRDTHKTFDAYVQERFGIKKSQAYNLIDAAGVTENVHNCGQISNEGQARELAKAPPEQQQAVVDKAAEIAESTGKKVTAATIKQAREEVVGPTKPKSTVASTTTVASEPAVAPCDAPVDEYEDADPPEDDPSTVDAVSVSKPSKGPIVHAKKSIAALEAAMRHCDDYKRERKFLRYKECYDAIALAWEILRAES